MLIGLAVMNCCRPKLKQKQEIQMQPIQPAPSAPLPPPAVETTTTTAATTDETFIA